MAEQTDNSPEDDLTPEDDDLMKGSNTNAGGVAPRAAPDTPTGLSATVNGTSTTINLSWNRPSGEVFGYFLREWRSDDQVWRRIPNSDTQINEESYTRSGRTRGVRHYYSVLSGNSDGNSLYSSPASATIAPNPPTVVAISDSSIRISWPTYVHGGDIQMRWKATASSDWTTESAGAASPKTVVGLSASTEYEAQIRSNGPPSSNWSASDTATTSASSPAPGVPTNLSASRSGSNVVFSWDAPTSGGAVSEYRYQTRINSANHSALTSTTSRSVTVGPVSTGDSVWIQVQARNDGGESNYVNTTFIVPAPTPTVTVPGTPTGLTNSASTTTSLTFTWSAGSGGTPTSYEAQYKRSSDSNYSNSPDDTSPATISTLDADTTYNFRVRARNSAGVSNYASTSGTTEEPSDLTPPPTAPDISNRIATVGTPYSQTLAAGSGGDTPLSYSVSNLPPGLSFNTSTRVISGTPTTVGTTTVTYTVTDDDGDSDTDTFTITVVAAAEFTLIANPGAEQVSLTWTEKTWFYQGQTQQSSEYTVKRRQGTSGSFTSISSGLDSTARSYIDTNVTAGDIYQYLITARFAPPNWYVDTNTVSVTPTATDAVTTAPGTPTGLTNSASTTTSLTFTWSAGSGGSPTSYEAQYKRNSDSNYSNSPDDTSPATISTLDADTTYNFRVRARNSIGVSNYVSVNGTTDDTPPDSTDFGLTATPGDEQVILSFSRRWLSGRNSWAKKYNLERRTTGSWSTVQHWSDQESGSTTTYTHTDSSVTVGTIYTYRVGAYWDFINQNLELSDQVTIMVTATVGTAPDAPTNLRVTNSTTTLLSFSWDAPTTGGEPTAYESQYKLSTAANYPDDSSSSLTTAASLTELAEGTTYNFRVRATNASGQSGWVTLTATTTTTIATTAPGVPTNLAVTDLGTTQLSFTWEAPASGGTPRGYNPQSRLSTGTWPTMVGSETTSFGLSRGPVSPGETIVFRVRAINNIGSSAFVMISYTVPGVSTEVPGSVTGLFTGEATDNSFTVTWSAPTDGGIPDGYHVQFKRNVDSLYQNAPDTISPSVITGLDSGTLYDVQVRGYNTTGNGGWSGDQITTTGDPADESAAPGTPTAIFAIGLDADTINVSWNPPVSGGTAISYEIQYRRQGTSNWTEVTGIPSTSRGLHGLQASTTYQIQIRARNSMGASDWVPSIPYTAATIVPISENLVPSEPLRFQVDARSAGVLLTWLAPEETGSGGDIIGYNIWRHDGNDWRQIVANTNDAERRYIDGETTLVEGRTYSYAIRAINSAGPGKWSQVTSAIINPQVPSAPRRFQADAQTSGVVMSWLEPADSGTGGAVSGYNIWRKGSGVWREIVVDTDSTSTSYTDTDEDLITGAQYSFSIRAINNAGHGEWSAVIPVIINPNFPSAPRRLTAIKIGQGITLTWLAPADNGFGGPVTGYTIWRNDGSGWRELVSNTGDTNRSYNDTSATGTNITYWYTVRAINAAGPGEWSETAIWSDVDVELEEQRTSSVPRRLEVDAQSSGVVMTWLAPAIPGSAGAVTGYNIWRKKSGGNWGAIVSNTNSGVTNYLDTDENLEDGKRYWYAVRAINAGGYSEWSETASAIINPQVPSAPRRLFVDAQSTGVVMNWLAPIDTGLGGAIVGYNIWRHNGEEWGEIVEDTGNAGTSYLDTDTTLELGKVYWYAIRAINGQGPGEWSEVTSVLINPQVPSAPRRFQADAQSLGVVMSWLEPLDNGTGGSINNYEVWRHNGTEWAQVHTTEDGDTLFWLDVATLIIGKVYWYVVRATNDGGGGEWSAVTSVLINPQVASAPRRFQADAQSTGVVMSWLVPFDKGLGGDIESYNIWRHNGEVWVNVHTTDSPVLTWTDTTPLITDKWYRYSIRAINPAGPGEWSAVVSVNINPDVPSAPRRLTATESEEGVVLAWLPPADNGLGGAIIGYNIWRFSDHVWGEVATIDGDELALTYTDMSELTEGWHYWNVRAINDAGPGEWSQTAGVTTATNLPSAPGSLIAIATGSGVNLLWEPPLLDGGSPIIGYSVWRSNGIEWVEIETDTGDTDAGERPDPAITIYTDSMIAALGAGTYYYRVQALTEVGAGDFSAAAMVTVGDIFRQAILGGDDGGRATAIAMGTIAHVGSPLSYTVPPETRGTPPYTYEMPNPPQGLTFNPSNQILSGIPTTTVTPFRVLYDVVDSDDDVYPRGFDLYIEDEPFVISVDSLSLLEGGLQAEAENFSFTHHGGPDVATVNVVGPREALNTCLGWLRHPIEIHGREGGVLWWGYIQRVTENGGAIQTSTNLNQYYTSVAMTHVHEFRPGEIDVNRTQWRLQRPYNERYGDVELLVNRESEGLRPAPTTSELDGIISPFRDISSSIEDSRQSASGVVLNCVGWSKTIGNQHVQRYPKGVYAGIRSTNDSINVGGRDGNSYALWVDYPTGSWTWDGNPYLTGVRFDHRHDAPGLGSKTIKADVRIAKRADERPGVPPGYTSYSPSGNPDTNDYPEEWLSDWMEISLPSNPGYGNNPKWETYEIDFSPFNIKLPKDGFYFVFRNKTGPGLRVGVAARGTTGLISSHVIARSQYKWRHEGDTWVLDTRQTDKKFGCDVFLGGDIATVMDVSLNRHTTIRAAAPQIGINRKAPQASFALYREGTEPISTLLNAAIKQTSLRYRITPDRKLVLENQPSKPAQVGVRRGIFDDDVTKNTPGVIFVDTLNPGEVESAIIVGDPNQCSTVPIDSPYVTDAPAYISELRADGNNLVLYLASIPWGRGGGFLGPVFSPAYRDRIGLGVKLADGTVLAWRLSALYSSDTRSDERYSFPGSSLAGAGTSNTDFQAAVANYADQWKRVVLVDINHSNINWSTLEIISDVYPDQSGQEDKVYVLNRDGTWGNQIARGRADFVGEWIDHDGIQSYCVGASYEVRTGVWDISYKGEASAYAERSEIGRTNVADPRQGPGGG